MPLPRSLRVTALVVLTLSIGLLPGRASAGEPAYLASIESVCEIGGGGDYTVIVRITNLLDVETQVTSGQFAFVTGSSTIYNGTTVFVPNPVPAGGTTVAMITGPGDSVFVEVGFSITALELDDTASLELDGNCAAPPTSPSTQTAPTTASTVETAAVVQPRFTG